MVRNTAGLLLAAALAGCTAGGGLFRGGEQIVTPTVTAPPGAGQIGSNDLALYFETLRSLIEGDPVVQADTFRNVAAAADVAPTTTNRLHLALALATPGHPSSDPAAAQRALSELLAAGDALLPEERILALVHLKEVEQRLILDAEAQRLQRAAQTATTQRNDQAAERLRAALEENRQLRLALDEARAKLDAITNIERSIRERENATNPR
jgi:hypothetical protein